MSEHTPGPWTMGEEIVTKLDGYFVKGFAISGGGQAIARVWNGTTRAIVSGNGEANAAFIVRACNAHDDMLAALKVALALLTKEAVTTGDGPDQIRAAIVKARGAP